MKKQPKLVYRLILLERALVFQILAMDERFYHRTYVSKNKHDSVASASVPDISMGSDWLKVYLRGDNSAQDYNPVVETFVSNPKRDACARRITALLKEWSTSWKEFITKDDTESTDYGDDVTILC